MFIDLTLKITPQMARDAQDREKKALSGHLGTHFDVMNKEFPLEYVRREAVVFDVRAAAGREIGISDIDTEKIKKDMFVAFYTGFIEKEPYGGKAYFKEHPQLSTELIGALVKAGISIIGIDFAGVRRGKEHTPADRFCADHGVFVVENLCHLHEITAQGEFFTAHTYPMNYTGMTGLPCRVVAEV